MTSTGPFPSYLGRDRQDLLLNRMHEIAEHALESNLLLMIGAGFSKDARNLPMASGLAGAMVRKIIQCDEETASKVARKYGLASIAQQMSEAVTQGRADVAALLRDALTPKDLTPSTAQDHLRQIASVGRPEMIFTTNYDSLVEESLGDRAFPVGSTLSDIKRFREEAERRDITGVAHLMGTLDDFVITEDDLRNHKSLLLEEFRHQLVSKVLVMIGYSFGDESLRLVFEHIYDLLRASGGEKSSYVVMPVENQTEYAIGSQIWRARGRVELIPLKAGEFLKLLCNEIRAEKGRRIGHEIRTNYPMVSEDTLRETLETVSGSLMDFGDDDHMEVIRGLLGVKEQ